MSEMTKESHVQTVYTNYRDETSVRLIVPRPEMPFWFGKTRWHPEPQWFLSAVDVNEKHRDFAVAGFHAWSREGVNVWKRERSAATILERLGYTYVGTNEFWRPPLGPAPLFDRLDARRDLIVGLEALAADGPARGQDVASLLRKAAEMLWADHPFAASMQKTKTDR